MDVWISDLESKVYSRIKHNIQGAVTAKFPGVRFTSSSESSGTTTLPCVYMHEIEGSERNRTLEEGMINAYTFYMEIRVTVDTQREDVKWIVDKIMSQCKTLGFAIITKTPVYTSADTYYQIFRIKRVFGRLDTF